MTDLKDQIVLVTGANRGMGREYITQLLDERGVAKVYATARNPASIDVTDSRVTALRLDVTDAASVAAAADAAPDVGVLINNAGIVRGSSVLSTDTTGLREELETNLFGPLAVASAFADRIAERGAAIVNVSADVVRQVLDGVESGADEVLADEMTRQVRAQLGTLIHHR